MCYHSPALEDPRGEEGEREMQEAEKFIENIVGELYIP